MLIIALLLGFPLQIFNHRHRLVRHVERLLRGVLGINRHIILRVDYVIG